MHFLTFDTNIYRELGIAFNNNLNFDYLLKFLEKSHYELVLQDVVYKELVDYFENDYLKKLIYDHNDIYNRFNNNPYIKNINKINSEHIEKDALEKYKEKLNSTCWRIQSTIYVDSELLVDFLISNKRESKKDNTRDFLIWNNLLSLAEERKDDKIIFISRDKIFIENKFFRKLLSDRNINNVIVIESIPKYLSDYGLQIEFLNNDIVLNSVKKSVIETNLLKDINCFPSYVSTYYNRIKPPKNKSFEILDIQVYDYYTFSEDKSDITLISSFLVKVKAIYEKELRVDLNEFPKDYYYEEINHRIDNENRPIYENYVLCMFEGNIDLKSEKIINQKFSDFIPDWNIEKE